MEAAMAFAVPSNWRYPATIEFVAVRRDQVVIHKLNVDRPGLYSVPTVAALSAEHGPFTVKISFADGDTEISPPFGLPDYRCPKCGTLSEAIAGEQQALCTNTPGCDVYRFDPSLVDGQYVTLS